MRIQVCVRRWAVGLLLMVVAVNGAAREVKELFVAMPDSVVPLLSAVNRADLVDFMASGMKAVVTNRLNGKTEMTQLSPTYLRLSHSGKASWQMKLLTTAAGDTLICVVATAETPLKDSHLICYDTAWRQQPLNSVMPTWPQLADFRQTERLAERPSGTVALGAKVAADTASVGAEATSNAAATGAEAAVVASEPSDDSRVERLFSRIKMTLIEATLYPDNEELTLRLTSTETLEPDEAEQLKPLLRSAKRYRWQGNGFLPVEE